MQSVTEDRPWFKSHFWSSFGCDYWVFVWANLYIFMSFNRSVIIIFQMNVIRFLVRMVELVLTGDLSSRVNVLNILVGGCVKLVGTGSLQQKIIVKFWKTHTMKSIYMQCKTGKIQEQIKFKLVAFEGTTTLRKWIINNIRIWLKAVLNLKSKQFLSRLQPEFGLSSCPQKSWQWERLTADEWCANSCGKSKWLRSYILTLTHKKKSTKT